MRKIPKKPKGKGKRWAKGHSCSSNPATKKFRDAAKSRFFYHDTGSNALTVGALKTLDTFNNHKYGINSSTKDTESWASETIDSWTSSKTFKTFASDWSNCSNISFNRLFNKFEPKSFLHKEMLAVLAAVTEVIKANGGKETSTEYFGALLSTLGVTEEEETVAAILSLLSMGIKSVPNEVLRLKFSEISKVLLEILRKYSELENAVILRAAIGCLSVTLRNQDPGIWSYSSTQQVFHSLLIFSTHHKPKVRKASQHAVAAILKASILFGSDEIHPAAVKTAKYCIEQIESGSVLGGNTIILHTLSLLKEIIGCFSRNYIKAVCETLLKLMTLGTPIVTSCSLEVLHNLFAVATAAPLDPILNAKILNALYDYQPSMNDPQATIAWLTVMQEAHKALARNNPTLCCDNLGKFFSIATNLWLSDKIYILQGCTSVLRTTATDCIPACSGSFRYSQICKNIFGTVESCLKFQFNKAWTHVFSVLGLLFEIIGKQGEVYMRDALKTLGDLRETPNFLYISELDYTIGKAIRALGPETILVSIPISITGQELNYEFKNSWLLPILKDNIQTSSLKFFIQRFLPMVSICENKIKELNGSNNKIGAHSYDLLLLQIWSLLPSICNGSADVSDNFRFIAKTLGDLIANRKHIRMHAMASIRKLIQKNKALNNEENIQELSRYSKNYLPILFDLFLIKPIGTDDSGERLAAYETITVYLTITSIEECGNFYDAVLKKIDEINENDVFTKESLMDLLKVLIPYQNTTRLNKTYDFCLQSLKTSKSKKEEKKFYRLLEVMIASESETCKKFMELKKKELLSFVIKSIKSSKIMNRGARLRCIFYLVKILSQNQLNIIKSLIPEAVTCCKDINKNTRIFAYRLLEEMFYIMRNWTSESNEEAVRKYISIIVAGLAGTPTLVSATILALGKMTHTLKTEMPSDIIDLLIENICLLSALPQREIVCTTLDYIKIFLSSFPKNQIFTYVPKMVGAITAMTEDSKNHFRMKIRDILNKFMKKFGYDIIQALIPSEEVMLQRRLKNLKKINDKKKTTKAENEKEDMFNKFEEFTVKTGPKSIEEILATCDDSADDPDAEDIENKPESSLFIQEDDDNIVDFTSPSTSSKITAVLPVSKKVKKATSDFKFTDDGRMIIGDISIGNEDDFTDNDDTDGDDDDDDGKSSNKLNDMLTNRKRKLSGSSKIPAKYQAGGSGIHRIIRKPAVSGGKLCQRKKRSNINKLPALKTGKEYRAKKARGDVKLKGKLDPYAYIPLSRKYLKARQKVKKIVRSAIKGAKVGTKLKEKNKKKR